MQKIFEKLYQDFPSLAITLGVVIIIIYVLREYRKMREENRDNIQQIVDAKLGSILTGVQAEIVKLNNVRDELETKTKEVEATYHAFSEMVILTTESINSIASDAERKLEKLNRDIPDIEDYSATDIIGVARQESDEKVKAELCTRVLNHADSTSIEYELAGDIMRESNRIKLALQLYQKAVSSDPERQSSHIELLCLNATYFVENRDHNLNKAKHICRTNISKSFFSKVANVLIHLERHKELFEFSNEIITLLNGKQKSIIALAKRNLASAQKSMGDIEASIFTYEEALQIEPDDENILNSYTNTLKEFGIDDHYLKLCKKLLYIDPTDLDYYIKYIDALLFLGEIDESKKWFNIASKINSTQMQQAKILKLYKRIEALENLTNGSTDAA